MQACFLGSFQHNKGILQVLESWPLVREALPDARLIVLGQGTLINQVEQMTKSDSSISLRIAPTRRTIRDTLRASVCLVLLSRRTPTFREQVGLPIVEGLEQGCEIVTTPETGIADWLAEHGHAIVENPDSPQDVAAAIVRALTSDRLPEDIVAALPSEDARLEADRWLFR
jgi:glycosyltransferase involved in cell wall biosynthesis